MTSPLSAESLTQRYPLWYDQADKNVNELEAFMADLLGQKAALFCASGTMTNQLGLRTLLTQPPHSVLCDARAHIFIHECGGLSYHSQASVTPVMPKNGKYLTVEDVKANIVTDTLCGAPTRGEQTNTG